MKKLIGKLSQSKAALLAMGVPAGVVPAVAATADATVSVQENAQQSLNIVGARMINPTTLEILYSNGTRMSMDFYGENIFRIFQDNQGGIIRDPQATPEAQILVDNPRKTVSQIELNDQNGVITVQTKNVKIDFDKKTTLFKVTNLKSGKVVAESVAPVQFEKGRVTVSLKEQNKEYFYGGGVQNGRFSHKGQEIEIVNTNNWTDGGVASPTPFYWSTEGYGIMWHTFKPGKYDFGAAEKGKVVVERCVERIVEYMHEKFGC